MKPPFMAAAWISLVGALLAPALACCAPLICSAFTSAQIQANHTLVDEAVRLAPYAIMSNIAYARSGDSLPLPAGWREVAALRENLPAGSSIDR